MISEQILMTAMERGKLVLKLLGKEATAFQSARAAGFVAFNIVRLSIFFSSLRWLHGGLYEKPSITLLPRDFFITVGARSSTLLTAHSAICS